MEKNWSSVSLVIFSTLSLWQIRNTLCHSPLCATACVCVCIPTVRVSAHGEVQHGVAELVLCLLLQLLTQTLQGGLVLCNTNSSQLQSVSERLGKRE